MTTYLAAPAPAPTPAEVIPQLPQDVEPNPTLIPQEGVDAVNAVLGTTMWVVLFVLMATALASIGFAAVAKATGRPQMMDRGLILFGWCLGLAVLTGLAIPLVNNFYDLT